MSTLSAFILCLEYIEAEKMRHKKIKTTLWWQMKRISFCIITYICIIFCIPDSYLPFLLISTNLTASVNLTWSTEIDFVNFATLWWTELMLTPIDWLHPLPFFQILFNPSFFMTLSCFLDLSIPKNDIYHKDNSLAYKAIWAISSMLTCLATFPL